MESTFNRVANVGWTDGRLITTELVCPKVVLVVLENEASRGKGNLRAGRYGIYTQVPRTTFRSGIRA